MTGMFDEDAEAEAGVPEVAGGSAPRLVVGIGASAGGIKVLKEFFANVPPRSGLAYVVILHLSPDHESRLAEVLQAATSIPVRQVVERVRVEADHVYVIPPNRSLTIVNDALVVSDVSRTEQRRAPVDVFFRGLAEAYGASAVSVILSGTGSDGSSGFKRVKEHGGLTIAQAQHEAEYGDMPANAVATGSVDVVLPVAQMPRRILEYSAGVQDAERRMPPRTPPEQDDGSFREVLTALRARTGQDFSTYKPGTVLRRIQRRLGIHQLSTLEEYARWLRDHPDEPAALKKDLLISVTNFFRDRESFGVLERTVVGRLFSGKQPQDQVRVWSAGCATGEEAYSLAILLAEHAATLAQPPGIQIFATDLDDQAIASAREGLYSSADVADVSDARLHQFFELTAGGFRVRQELRELVLFARHDVINDPPFSHLDLIACRNVLIYLKRSVQARLLEIFHFALHPGGVLMLGTSESSESTTDLFRVLNQDAHLYESRPAIRPAARVPFGEVLAVRPSARSRLPVPAVGQAGADRMLPADIHQRLLEQYAPPSLIVTDEYRLLHVSERAGRYLQIAGGEPSVDVLQLVRSELRGDLRAALHEATRLRSNVQVGARLVDATGDVAIRIHVRPVVRDHDPAQGIMLVLFEEATGEASDTGEEVQRPTSAATTDVQQLDEELTALKRQLRATIEQYETQVEEARASNEELQAMNEELRSTTEELETSKEELQSVNEELTTVNQELKIKIEELALANNDFQNLINSTGIATIFLDRSLRVKLSTAGARDVFNLRPADIGRPLTDITNRLVDERLHDEVRDVLQRLQTVEREVRTIDQRWYLMRILPYRTTDDRIDGVAITFLDITSRHQAESQVTAGEERLRLLIESAVDYAIFTMTSAGRVDSWNAGAQRMFGYSADEIIGSDVAILFTPEDQAAGVPADELARARAGGRIDDERWHVRKDGTRLYCALVTTRLGEEAGLGFATIGRDLTPQRQTQAELEARVQQRTHELQTEVAQRDASQEHVTMLLRRLVTAQEDQRARIARDLHDQLGQQLTALRLTLERHRERCRGEGANMEELQAALGITAEIDEEVDFLAWELRPVALDDLGLSAALPRFLQEWSQHYGIHAEFRSSGFHPGQLSREAEVTFYRIAQETLNNVIKHAHASRVDVILETRKDTVTLVIEDDGVGFDQEDLAVSGKGFGLIGMRERAALVGATLHVEAAPDKGTTVFLRYGMSNAPPRHPAS